MFAGCSALFFAAVAVLAIAIALRALGLAKELQREVAALKRRVEPEPEPEPETVGEAPAATPGPEASVVPQLSTQDSAPSTRLDFEQLIGVKLFSWIAGVALVLAAVFFLSYSVQHGWIGAPLRAAIGIATGLALLGVCELRVSRDYKLTADALDGAGVAILYATLFAMYALWHLLGATSDFLLMLVVTAIAVYLSVRRNSAFIALLGLLGGFATPALLSSGDNRPIALFSYLLLLNIGLAWVASTKRWPVLTAISIVLTAAYEWWWIARFLTVSQFPLAATIFALFAITAASAMWLGRGADERQPQFDYAAIAGAVLPLAFAMFAAAVPAYGARFHVLFAFLLLVTTALGVISIFREPPWLHLAGGATSVVVVLIWFAYSYTPDAWPSIVAWIAAFVLAQLATAYFNRGSGLTAAPLLFVVFPVLMVVERSAGALPIFATLFVLLAVVAIYATRRSTQLVYLTAGALTFLAEVVWVVKNGSDTVAVVVAFAMLFLAVPVIAKRFGAMAFLALGAYALLIASGIGTPSLFIALALVGPAIGIGALLLEREALMDGAAIGSQLALIVWAANTHEAEHALLATVVVTAVALIWFVISRSYWRAAMFASAFGFVVAMIAATTTPRPSLVAVGATHVLLLAAFLVATRGRELAIVGVPLAALATALAHTSGREQLFLAAPVYALFILFALVDGTGAARITAALASVAFFVLARPAIDPIALLPLFEAAALGAVAWRWRRLDPVLAAGALAFACAVIPLQFSTQWIPMTLALEGAALLWLFRFLHDRDFLVAGSVAFRAAFAWLLFARSNPALLVCGVAFYAGAILLEERKEVLASGGTILLFILINTEVADVYAARTVLARDLAYTIAWALFALALLVGGIALRSRGNRIAAIALLLATILKCFLHDLANLGGLYRVGSLLGLALSLVLVGVLLQRFVRSSSA